MSIRKSIAQPTCKLWQKLKWALGFGGIANFTFPKDQDISEDIRKKYNFSGDLLQLFVSNEGVIVHKWHHFIPLYDRYFKKYRGTEVRFLEIGVNKGGSLQMWRNYFGDQAIIFGIDFNPECASLNGQSAQVRIGSQIDSGFLESVILEMGGLDVVLDDGSHHMKHIRASLDQLFPHLSDGGIYMIEDLHTAYWRNFGGGFGHRQNFFNYLNELVNDMHHWYHTKKVRHPAISQNCTGLHIHDSIVVLEKSPVFEPAHSKIGSK